MRDRRLLGTAVGAALGVAALGFVVAPAQQLHGPAVFLAEEAGSGAVAVNLDVLADARVRLGAGERPILRLNLSGGVEIVAEIEATEPTSAGYSLKGRPVEGPGSLTLVVNGNAIAGSVAAPDGTYAIRPAGEGRAIVREVDLAALRPGRDDVVRPARRPREVAGSDPLRAPEAVAAARPPVEDGTRIDVLAFFTREARAEYGGGTVAGMRATIDLVVAEVNDAYAASGVVARLNLAAPPVQAPFREAGSTAEDLLERLRHWSRGNVLRDRHAADLVTLMTGGRTADIEQTAGIAYGNEPDNAPERQGRWAYSVGLPARDVFGHETGHNMGLDHERYQLVLEGVALRTLRYPGGVGFAGPIDNDARTPCLITIMAYGTECFETEGMAPLWWVHVPRFSNPNRKFDGLTIGVRGDKPSGRVEGPAYAARTLNRMKRFVANWRRAPCLRGGAPVRLQASNGQYVVAVGNGGGAVVANQPRPGPRGRFTLVDHDGGPCVASGDVVSLHTSDGFYLRAERGGGGQFDATAPRATPWARFVARRHRGSGAFRAGDVLTLQTHSGHYVVAENGGGGAVRADRETPAPWARFRVSR